MSLGRGKANICSKRRKSINKPPTKIIFNKTGFIASPTGCPTTRLIKTEYLDLFLSTVPTFPVTSEGLEIDKYINNRDNYLSYQAEKLSGSVRNAMSTQLCQQKYQNEQGHIRIDEKH